METKNKAKSGKNTIDLSSIRKLINNKENKFQNKCNKAIIKFFKGNYNNKNFELIYWIRITFTFISCKMINNK